MKPECPSSCLMSSSSVCCWCAGRRLKPPVPMKNSGVVAWWRTGTTARAHANRGSSAPVRPVLLPANTSRPGRVSTRWYMPLVACLGTRWDAAEGGMACTTGSFLLLLVLLLLPLVCGCVQL